MDNTNNNYTLAQLGWNQGRQEEWDAMEKAELLPARISTVSHSQCRLLGLEEPVWATYRGKLAGITADEMSTPTAGDYALVSQSGESYVVEHILPRHTQFVRKVSGKTSKPQVIAANVDRVFIVTAVGRDFNPRRLERYLAAVWDSGAEPIIVVNKIDEPHDLEDITQTLNTIAFGVTTAMVSAVTEDGLQPLYDLCLPQMTIALVGSSGVGKSTIVNHLLGHDVQRTFSVRESDTKGRHTTTAKEMFITPTGSILIDTPGIRELGLWNAEEGLERVFEDVMNVASECRYRNCNHLEDPGCALTQAIEDKTLDKHRVESFLRLTAEHEELAERAAKRKSENSKKRFKSISKEIRRYKKITGDS